MHFSKQLNWGALVTETYIANHYIGEPTDEQCLKWIDGSLHWVFKKYELDLYLVN